MGDIAYQNKDIASKVTGEALMGKSLRVFGLPHLTVTGILPTNLPAIESNELRLDNLFVLSDGSVAIIDYESDYDRENFIKYLNYIARVLKRYARQSGLDSLRQLRMVVIYTADVEHADSVYDLGSLVLVIESAFLIGQDTEGICSGLERKIRNKEMLDEEELMQLMILPLTVKGRREKQDVILKAVHLARQIPDKVQTVRALAGILTFTDKIIEETYRDIVKEELHMTQIEQMIFNEGVEKGMKQGMERGMKQGMERGIEQGMEQGMETGSQNRAYSAARNMYSRGFSEEDAAGLLEEELSVVKRWYSQWRHKG